jgi:hypothetical protein
VQHGYLGLVLKLKILAKSKPFLLALLVQGRFIETTGPVLQDLQEEMIQGYVKNYNYSI